MPCQTQSTCVLQQFDQWAASAHSHTLNHLSSLDGKPRFPKSHITLPAQPGSFCWLRRPESWHNTIFFCHWGGFRSTVVLLIASCVSVYHLQSWEHVLSCLKQSTFLLRAKAMKRLCHCSTNFPCKSDPEVNAWQPPSVMYLRSWNKGMCLQMSGCGFTWQFGMWVSGWICMYCQRQLHLMMALRVLAGGHFTTQDVPFQHRLTWVASEGADSSMISVPSDC